MTIRLLVDLTDASGQRRAGELVDLDADAARHYLRHGLAAPVRAQPEAAIAKAPAETATVSPRFLGGGWYELPSGRRVQGRAAALRAMADGR